MKSIQQCKCPFCKTLFRVESPETDLEEDYVVGLITKKLQENLVEHLFSFHKEEIKWQEDQQ